MLMNRGHRVPVKIFASPRYDDEGRIIGILEVFRDTSERRISYEKVEARWKKMYTDTLVGIGNSRFCEKEQDKCLVEFHRHGVPFTAAVCEVDGFRDLIEKCGPEQGDDILWMVGRTLSNILRDDGLRGKCHEERFLLILPAMYDSDESTALMERIRILVQESCLTVNGELLGVTVSIGVSCAQPGDDRESFYEKKRIANVPHGLEQLGLLRRIGYGTGSAG